MSRSPSNYYRIQIGHEIHVSELEFETEIVIWEKHSWILHSVIDRIVYEVKVVCRQIGKKKK